MAYNKTIWVNDNLPAINAENLNNMEEGIERANNFIDQLYKVGDLFLTINSENPSVRFGGTWELFGKGKTLVCVDEEDSDFNIANKTGGEKTHTLTISEIPSHSHGLANYNANGGNTNYNTVMAQNKKGWTGNIFTENNGGGQPHNNIQPYITCYIWVRTA